MFLQSTCGAQGATLAVIDTADEDKVLRDMIILVGRRGLKRGIDREQIVSIECLE